MKIMIDDGSEFDFKFSCEEQDVRKMYIDELWDERTNIINEREGCSDFSVRGQVLDIALAMVENEIADRKNKTKLNNELIDAIIDGLDDWLYEKKIVIPNGERDKQDPEANTNFWGDDYDDVMNMIRECLRQYGIVVEDEWNS